MEKSLITIGFDKNGEAEFGILMSLADLSREQLKELREIIVVAIYEAEDIWRRAHQDTSAKKVRE
ncbi:MAG TPA: hypothetical protein VF974_04715 [Patescibacteria group bacterium]